MPNADDKRYYRAAAVCFLLLSIGFIVLAALDRSFFNWSYERHQNQLSWYIRPLFLIPFCYFAYNRSWAGISGTVFLLLTSMFWFPKPDTVNESAKQFLEMEKEWLTGHWSFSKILMTLLVPVSLYALGAAFWKRSLSIGLSVITLIAVAKMIWSVAFGGQSGKSIFVPAIVGLIVCIVLIYRGFKRLEKRKG